MRPNIHYLHLADTIISLLLDLSHRQQRHLLKEGTDRECSCVQRIRLSCEEMSWAHDHRHSLDQTLD